MLLHRRLTDDQHLSDLATDAGCVTRCPTTTADTAPPARPAPVASTPAAPQRRRRRFPPRRLIAKHQPCPPDNDLIAVTKHLLTKQALTVHERAVARPQITHAPRRAGPLQQGVHPRHRRIVSDRQIGVIALADPVQLPRPTPPHRARPAPTPRVRPSLSLDPVPDDHNRRHPCHPAHRPRQPSVCRNVSGQAQTMILPMEPEDIVSLNVVATQGADARFLRRGASDGSHWLLDRVRAAIRSTLCH